MKVLNQVFSFAVFSCGLWPSGYSQQVLRGPYLQNPTSSGMVIRWRTDVATDSRVYYGTSLSTLTSNADNSSVTTEHSVNISGLSPYTKYFYSVGSSTQTQSGPDSMYHFVTSPVPGTVQPFRIWAIGDFGKGNDGQKKVRDAFMNYTVNDPADVWLWLGDNAYSNGTDAEYQTNVFDSTYAYQKIMTHLPFMPCPGNHDYLSVCEPYCNTSPPNHTGPYYDIIDVPKNGEAGGVPSGYELYYSFDYGNVHFVSLNSELSNLLPQLTGGYNWTGANPSMSFNCNNSPMCQWLHNDLQANDKTFTVVYFHQPPYTDGSHDATSFWEVYMKAMREKFVPIFEQYGVDLVVCGHSHVYERTFMLKGHYGDRDSYDTTTMVVDGSSGKFSLGEPYIKDPSAPINQNGTVYVVVGNSGSKDDTAPLQYPAMYFDEACDTCWGSLIIDVDGNRLDAKYLRADGSFGDEFTIIKSSQVSIDENNALFTMMKVYPNPFNNQTNVEYFLREKAMVTIEMYDLAGKKVAHINSEIQERGLHKITFESSRWSISKGIYNLKIKGGEKSSCERLIKVE